MRAEIDSKGRLTVIPETDVERYALRRWWENFDQGDDTSILEVQLTTDESRENER